MQETKYFDPYNVLCFISFPMANACNQIKQGTVTDFLQ